jgi:putative transposase
MVEYRKNAHSIWDVKYHIVWITKYRYKVLRGEIAVRARELMRQICQGRDVVIVQGAVSADPIHMLVSVPPQIAPAKLVQYRKGRSSRLLQDEFPQLKKRYWGQPLWAGGYFCASEGVVDEATIRGYIKNQEWEAPGENFKITTPTEP